MDIHDLSIAGYKDFIPSNIYKLMDYKPFIPSSTGTPKSYEEEFKLNIGDIVAINTPLTSFDTNIGGRYKVMVIDTANEKYGIAPECSPFEIPKYFNRKDLILIHSATPAAAPEKSFLLQEGDLVSFKVSSYDKILTGHIIEKYLKIKDSYKNEKNYYKIKSLEDSCLYFIEESDIIEKIVSTMHESNSMEIINKAVNMENNIGQPKIGIGDIVSMSFPGASFDSRLCNQYKVTDISLKDGEYGLVHVYTPFETPKYCNKNNLILRRKASEKTPFLFQKGNLVQFKLANNDIHYGQIKELLSAATNVYKIKDLNAECLYIVKESNIERIAPTIYESNSIKASNKTEPLSAAKSLEALGKFIDSINEEKPLNIKIVKKRIKLNFKN